MGGTTICIFSAVIPPPGFICSGRGATAESGYSSHSLPSPLPGRTKCHTPCLSDQPHFSVWSQLSGHFPHMDSSYPRRLKGGGGCPLKLCLMSLPLLLPSPLPPHFPLPQPSHQERPRRVEGNQDQTPTGNTHAYLYGGGGGKRYLISLVQCLGTSTVQREAPRKTPNPTILE